jgi:hypothetical protein
MPSPVSLDSIVGGFVLAVGLIGYGSLFKPGVDFVLTSSVSSATGSDVRQPVSSPVPSVSVVGGFA